MTDASQNPIQYNLHAGLVNVARAITQMEHRIEQIARDLHRAQQALDSLQYRR